MVAVCILVALYCCLFSPLKDKFTLVQNTNFICRLPLFWYSLGINFTSKIQILKKQSRCVIQLQCATMYCHGCRMSLCVFFHGQNFIQKDKFSKMVAVCLKLYPKTQILKILSPCVVCLLDALCRRVLKCVYFRQIRKYWKYENFRNSGKEVLISCLANFGIY